MQMKLSESLKLLEKASDEDRREYAYRLWLARYPQYTEKTYESFDEFYEKIYPPKVIYDVRPKEELMNELLGLQGKEG